MTITEFIEKTDALREKSGMRPDIQWPIVLDSDEVGEIWIREDGRFFFADKCANWVESWLTLEDVQNLRFKAVNTEAKAEREIYINFASGDFIKIRNWRKNIVAYTSLSVQKDGENDAAVDALKDACECYDNLRGNTLYVTLRKPGK